MSRTRKVGERVSGLCLFSVQVLLLHLPLCLVCLPRRCILRQILSLLRHTVLHLLNFRRNRQSAQLPRQNFLHIFDVELRAFYSVQFDLRFPPIARVFALDIIGDMTADRSLIFGTVLVIFEFAPFHRPRRLHSELSLGRADVGDKPRK
jgi:hypothetical protein